MSCRFGHTTERTVDCEQGRVTARWQLDELRPPRAVTRLEIALEQLTATVRTTMRRGSAADKASASPV